MGRKIFVVKVPNEMVGDVRGLLDFFTDKVGTKREKVLLRQVLRKMPTGPRSSSVIDWVQFELGPSEAKLYNELVEIANYPTGVQARELRR